MAGTVISSSGMSHNRFKIDCDGINNVFTVTHNLGWQQLIVQVWDENTFEQVAVDIDITSVDTLDVAFAVVPAADKNYLVHIIGLIGTFI
jgi:hypothetical protein